mmetsp:Transcript_89297/g.257572  ORF Transcript_89297/g.257572 Transcript_89297/m.257572 type:complete len:504 (+) Transcript_89297:56-1567(+)
MIQYVSSNIFGLVRWRGSVAPKALMWSLPCATLAYAYHHLYRHIMSADQATTATAEPGKVDTIAWTLATSTLAFLLVFRAQTAYSRYWEGITLVERASAVWVNGCSNLIAFRSTDPAKEEAVARFLHMLTRIASLLLVYSLSEVSGRSRESFPQLSTEAFDKRTLEWLEASCSRQKVAMQWMQKLVVIAHRQGVIAIEPPILTRVFQEFSQGIVHLIEAKKLRSVPVPFHFAQLAWLLLVFWSTLCIPGACAMTQSAPMAFAYTLLIVFSFFCLHFLVVDLEMPYGEGLNALPLDSVAREFNISLVALLEPEAQTVPEPVLRVRCSSRWFSTSTDLPLLVFQDSHGVRTSVAEDPRHGPCGSLTPPSPMTSWSSAYRKRGSTLEVPGPNLLSRESELGAGLRAETNASGRFGAELEEIACEERSTKQQVASSVDGPLSEDAMEDEPQSVDSRGGDVTPIDADPALAQPVEPPIHMTPRRRGLQHRGTLADAQVVYGKFHCSSV